MAANKIKHKHKYVWGQLVKVKKDAPDLLRPDQDCSICGVRSIETENISKALSEPIGSFVYLVEFSDGYSIEIPEHLLEPGLRRVV
jgi:hypothetical protein